MRRIRLELANCDCVIFMASCHLVLFWLFVCGIWCERERFPVIKGVSRYLSCDVCSNVVYSLKLYTHALRMKAPYKRLDEESILTAFEEACDPNSVPGAWIRRLDIVEENVVFLGEDERVLALKDQESVGRCEEECKTIAKACTDLLEDDDFQDYFVTRLYKHTHIGQTELENLATDACSRSTSSCDKSMARHLLPPDFKYKDFMFKEITEQELEIENMMNKMDAAGYGDSMDVVNRDEAYKELLEDPYGDEMEDFDDFYGI